MAGVILAESFEAGPAAAAVTRSNSAFTDLVEPGWTFVADPASSQGSLAGHVSVSGGHAIAKRSFTVRDAVYLTFFLKTTAAPSSNFTLANLRASGTALADLQFTTDRRLAIRNSGFTRVAQTAANAIPVGAYCRVEWMLNTAADQQRLRVYTTDILGTAADFDSGLVATTPVPQVDTLNVGAVSSTTWDGKIDGLTARDDQFVTFTGPPTGGTPLPRASTAVDVSSSGTSTPVTVPSSGPGGTVVAGDSAVLIFFGAGAWTQTGPAGWQHVASQTGAAICADVWIKTLASGDINASLTVTSNNTANYKRQMHLLIFSAAQIGDVASNAAQSASTGHQTPQATAVDPNALALNAVADRGSPGSQAWTVPDNLSVLQQLFGSGGGAVSSVSAEDDLVGSGSVGSNTISGSLATNSAVGVTVIVEPSTAILGNTVNAGSDLTQLEPRTKSVIHATATGSPTGWQWTLVAPPDAVLTMSGDTTDTVTVTWPPAMDPVIYKLRATATYASGPPAVDDVNATVLPVTRAAVDASGTLVPLLTRAVT